MGRMVYFLTFTCYGSHLHGAATGSFERRATGTRARPAHPGFAAAMRRAMVQEPFLLTSGHRPLVMALVAAAVQALAVRRGWGLLAIHVRSTHVHLVLDCPVTAELALTAVKAAASAAFNRAGFEAADRRRWTRYGSTRVLPGAKEVEAAIHVWFTAKGSPCRSMWLRAIERLGGSLLALTPRWHGLESSSRVEGRARFRRRRRWPASFGRGRRVLPGVVGGDVSVVVGAAGWGGVRRFRCCGGKRVFLKHRGELWL